MAQHRPNHMETPITLAVEKDQELRRTKRRKAAMAVIAHDGYQAGPQTIETLQMLGLDDPDLRKRTP